MAKTYHESTLKYPLCLFLLCFSCLAYGHNASMTASLRRCGGLLDAARALVHLLCQLSRTIVPTATDHLEE